MRLVIDLQSVQGQSRQRGIGRQSLALSRAVVATAGDHEVYIALSNLFPDGIDWVVDTFRDILPPERFVILNLQGDVDWLTPDSGSAREVAELEREKQLQKISPDVVWICSLFEGCGDQSVITVKKTPKSYAEVVTLHDLMPLIHPGKFLKNPLDKEWYGQKVMQLGKADLLLAVSDSSRREAIEHLPMPGEKVVSVSSAVDSRFCRIEYDAGDRNFLLSRYGVSRPFIMFTGGDSPQKNIELLVRSFAELPSQVRKGYQLAIICKIGAGLKSRLKQLGGSLGLDPDDLVFTGYVSDENLIAFYNFCHVFVFPSWHEGFGLPVLEAMACGAPVLGSNATSIPEVVGWTEALFDPYDNKELTDKLLRVLVDKDFREQLSRHGIERSQIFSWKESACRAWEALEKLLNEPKRCCLGKSGPETGSKPQRKKLMPGSLQDGLVYTVSGRQSFIPFLGLGWSVPETWGIWSEERQCSLVMGLESLQGKQAFLRLDCRMFVAIKHPIIRLEFLVNGRAVLELSRNILNLRHTFYIPVKEEDAALCCLEIRIKNPRSPLSLGHNSDDRLLGIGLKSIALVHRQKAGLISKGFHYLHRHMPHLEKNTGLFSKTEKVRKDMRKLARAERNVRNIPGFPGSGTVSVVISTLNRSAALREALQSLEKQTFRNFEVIVINGPSSDDTERLLDQMSGRLKRGNCPEPNLSMSRNTGITRAAGNYVAFLDDDAVAEPRWLEEIVEGFDGPDVGAVGGKVLDQSGTRYQYEYASSNRLGQSVWNLKKSCPEFNYPGSYSFPYLQGTNAVFQREALLEIGGFDEAFAYYLDETEVCLRLNDAGFRIRQMSNARVIHKSASSGLRQDDIILDHTPILVSKIYFSNIHGRPYHSQRKIDTANRAFIQDYRDAVQLLVEKGRMTKEQAGLFEERATSAWSKAMEKASRPSSLLRPGSPPDAFSPFV